ncbi:hypothetical protein MMC30_003792 [Trapelia coarctata]|nr:hypothetical protein [Trapelia coarctata]
MTPPAAPMGVGSGNDTNKAPAKVVKRRNRVPLSCNTSHFKSSAGGTEDVRARVNRLEALVISLMPKPNVPSENGTSRDATPAISGLELKSFADEESKDEYVPEAEPSAGTMERNMNGQHYIGESHWDAVLRDITAVKAYVDVQTQQTQPRLAEPEIPALLAAGPRPVTKADMLASLPSKALADKFIVRFFDTYDPAVPGVHILHKPTFVKRYEHYREYPTEAPLIWFGLLYAIFCLAMQSYAREGDEPAEFYGIANETADIYRKRVAQCILSSDISAPAPYSIETTMLYGMSEYARLPDGNIGLWMVGGILIRKAMHMGYHRDPKFFPSISPFEGEIRRRVWMAIWMKDVLTSCQLGLPSMLRPEEVDVELPRYLYEEELFEDMQELPPSRSPDEPTLVTYMINKHHLLQVFVKVMHYVNGTKEHTYSQVLALNEELCTARAMIPPHLQLQGTEHASTPRMITLQRMQLQLFYHKAICVLNRRFLTVPGARTRFSCPRRMCIESAMGLLAIQARMHGSNLKWWHFSLTNSDFLLGSVIVCLVLHVEREGIGDLGAGGPGGDEGTREMVMALEGSKVIWDEVGEFSANARKAGQILGFMLEKLRGAAGEGKVGNGGGNGSGDGMLMGNAPVEVDDYQGLEKAEEVDMLDMDYSTLDWETWDSIIQGAEFRNLEGLWNV